MRREARDDITLPRPSWTIRRRIIVAALVYCGLAIGWIIANSGDASIANTLIYGALGIIGTYVFGAAWDDGNVMRYSRPRPNLPPPQMEDEP